MSETAAPLSWAVYSSESHGFSLSYPSDWTAAEGVLGTAVALIAPEVEPGGFLANFNVYFLEQVAPGVSTDDLAAAAAGEIAGSLQEALVIEQETVELNGHPAARVLASHREGAWALTLEQWLVPRERGRFVLSATTDTADYAAFADAMLAIAQSLSFDD